MTAKSATSAVYRMFAAAALKQVAWAADMGYTQLVRTFQADHDSFVATADSLAAQGR